MNEKWVEGSNRSWRLPPRRDYSDTLPVGPRLTGAGDPDEL